MDESTSTEIGIEKPLSDKTDVKDIPEKQDLQSGSLCNSPGVAETDDLDHDLDTENTLQDYSSSKDSDIERLPSKRDSRVSPIDETALRDTLEQGIKKSGDRRPHNELRYLDTGSHNFLAMSIPTSRVCKFILFYV